MPIRLVLVGLGRIAIGNSKLVNGLPLSHVDAALATGNFVLSGLVDVDADRRAYALTMFPDIPVVESLAALPKNTSEVIVICASNNVHAELAKQALLRKPAVVVVEKPMTSNFKSAVQLAQLVESAEAVLRINFHRRFDLRFNKWRNLRPMKPVLIEMRYGKGLLNYASHMIDWLVDWYGEIEGVRALPLRIDKDDDSSPSFVCYMAAGFEVVVLGVTGLNYDQFEIDILAANERLMFIDGGAVIRRLKPLTGKHYSGYSHLIEEADNEDIAPVSGFIELYKAIYTYCKLGEPLAGCDHNDGLLNMAVLEAVRLSISFDGKLISPRQLL